MQKDKFEQMKREAWKEFSDSLQPGQRLDKLRRVSNYTKPKKRHRKK
jgi:hypothetical protein